VRSLRVIDVSSFIERTTSGGVVRDATRRKGGWRSFAAAHNGHALGTAATPPFGVGIRLVILRWR
jgi:hypothetical protein